VCFHGQPRLQKPLAFLLCTVIFGLSYTQAPLFYSNQNQYFLHGLANAGHGFLKEDWLANTADPTPIFSALVAFTHRYLHESLFYVYYLFCLGMYAYFLLSLFSFLANAKPGSLASLCFFTLFALVHSGLGRLSSVQLLGKDYPWYFQAGVANQYILGFGLQPSVAGVFLVASLVAFIRDRPRLAVICSVLAATLHSTYLLGAALLTVAYMLLVARDKSVRPALLLGMLSLVLVLPVVLYNGFTFAPSSAAEFAEAQHILAHFRIPHHTLVERWLDRIAWAQLAWIILAIWFCRSTRLGLVLLLVSVMALLLTLLQLWTGSDTLALLFPWRISSVLVPIATTILLAKFIQALSPWLSHLTIRQQRGIRFGCGAVLGALVLGGLAIQWFSLAYRTSAEELDMMAFVRNNARPGDVYLIPVEAPRIGAPGSVSTSFLPPPRRDQASQHIPVDLQRFRLLTGVPIFVDFKAIPYKDVEVLRWRRRFDLCRTWYETQEWGALRGHGISHVVMPADRPVQNAGLEVVYKDTFYRVYRLHLEE
jgi:hypothetical protein